MARSTVLVSGAATISLLAHSAMALAADVTCYVDSVGGNDTNNGTSETTAWKSSAKLTGSSCTIVKFKRGSQFTVAKGAYAVDLMNLRNIKILTNYGDTNLPLPKFIKAREVSNGGMLASYMGGITIDGLYLSGSRSDANMSNLADGICVMLGANSTLINSEITLCDIGIMTAGDTVLVRNNYVHDLSISVDAAPGVDPNAVGGAEGIFVNSSHVEVDHNRFINCSTAAQWVTTTSGGKRCDGGATEVTVPYAGTVTDVRIHHNLSYRSCGFFEVASMFNTGSGAYVKGKFTNSVFNDNVMIDSGWISLLQINNTKLTNVRWENNTIVHHDLGKDVDGTDLNDFQSSGIVALPFNDTSSGVTGGGEIAQGDIYWTNNVWYFDPKVKPYNSTTADPLGVANDQFLKNVVQQNNLLFTTDPGFVSLAGTTNASDFDLVKGSQLIDKGVNLAEITADFLDRPAPVGTLDVGAFEYQANSTSGGSSGTGGTSAKPTGGAPATGGTSAKSTGGAPSVGGSGTQATGGAPTTITGGSPSTGGALTTVAGGSPNTGGAAVATGGTPPSGAGGTSSTIVATMGTGGASEPTSTTGGGEVSDSGSCSCKVPVKSNRSGAAAWIGLLMLGWGLRRRSSRAR